MTREEKEKYCEDMRDMFQTPGWLLLVSECEDAITHADNVDTILNLESLYACKGAKGFALQILHLPDSVRSLEDELEEPEQTEDIDASYI